MLLIFRNVTKISMDSNDEVMAKSERKLRLEKTQQNTNMIAQSGHTTRALHNCLLFVYTCQYGLPYMVP